MLTSEKATSLSNAMTSSDDGRTLNFDGAKLCPRTDATEYDKLFIPQWDALYEPDWTLFSAFALCVREDLNVLLVGPTGAGKSTAVLMLASLLQQPVRRVNMHGDIRSADFLGQKVLEPDPETKQVSVFYRHGVAPEAAKLGHWLLVDEIDATPAAMLMTIQAMLEPGHPIVLSSNHGEVVPTHPEFRILATANTLGHGDETGLYAGTNVLNEATLDRFVVLKVDYPLPEQEAKILLEKGQVDPQIVKMLVETARLVRNGYSGNECYCTLSTRRLITWCKLYKHFLLASKDSTIALRKSYQLAVGNKLSPEDSKYVAGVVQRATGIKVG